MIKKYNEFLNESFVPPYVTIQGNLHAFFESIGIDVEIQEDKQIIQIELPFNVTKKEEWWNDFVKVCNDKGHDFDEIYIKNNIIFCSRSLGLWSQPSQYNQFLD